MPIAASARFISFAQFGPTRAFAGLGCGALPQITLSPSIAATRSAAKRPRPTAYRIFSVSPGRLLNCEPVAHHLYVAERNAGLHHTEVSGVHADDQHAGPAAPVALQIFAVRRPGVRQRIVNVGNQPSEADLRNIVTQSSGD